MKHKPMECLTQTNSWSCGLLSWASLLRLTPCKLIHYLSPLAKKHIQLNSLAEQLDTDTYGLDMDHFIQAAQRLNKGSIVYDLRNLTLEKAHSLLKNKEGIIVFVRAPQMLHRHAVGWNGKTVLDPDTGERTLKSIFNNPFESFFTLYDIKQTDIRRECRTHAEKSNKTKR